MRTSDWFFFLGYVPFLELRLVPKLSAGGSEGCSCFGKNKAKKASWAKSQFSGWSNFSYKTPRDTSPAQLESKDRLSQWRTVLALKPQKLKLQLQNNGSHFSFQCLKLLFLHLHWNPAIKMQRLYWEIGKSKNEMQFLSIKDMHCQ